HALRPRGERAQPVGRDAPPRSRADPAGPFLHRDDECGVDDRVCRARRRDWSEHRISAGAGIRTAARRPAPAPVPALAARAVVRWVHELCWPLLLSPIGGLSAPTGILAVAIPYSGIFAKVFAEMIEEADLSAERVLPAGTSIIARFAYARIPELAPQFWTYTLYRLECGLRSTLVLGFVGLPTIGFHLDSFFKQGPYPGAAAPLLAFYVLFGTGRLWAGPSTVPILIIASVLVLPETIGGGSALANLTRFLTHDIIPTPLRNADLLAAATWENFFTWLTPIITKQAVPGVIQTLVLSQVALVAMGAIALILFPFICRRFAGRLGRPLGRVALVVVRSTPEYMLVYVLLQLLGPSMLPAIIALSLHNGAIVGYLMGRHADVLDYRRDAPRGV